MNRSLEDSGGRPQGGLDGYQTGKPAVLDHLVPIGERKEDAPALLYQGDRSSHHPLTVMQWRTTPSRLYPCVKGKVMSHAHQRSVSQSQRYGRMLPGMCADEDDINHEELDCMREAWQDATDRASSAQELWNPSLLQQLNSCFAQIVRVSPDSPGNDRSTAIWASLPRR